MFGKQFRRMEECIEGMTSYFNFTVMRMAWFMDNFLDMAADIVSNNRFLSSWGPSSVSAVSLADVGRSAAAVLSCPKGTSTHFSRTYHLTGPESLSGFRMAETFSKVLGRQIAYQDLPRDEMRKVYSDGMRLEAWQADGYVEMNELFKSGAGAAYSTDVAMLTRGNHTTLERFVRNKRWYFAGQRSPLICILPASGRIGNSTLAALMRDKSRGRIRAVVRGAEHKTELETKYPNESRLEVVNGDFEDAASMQAAFQGVDSLLIIPPERLERFSLIDEAIRAAHTAGVGHTILFSVAKALDATALGRKFNAWERVLEQNAHAFTIVQSSLFHDLMFHFAEQAKQPERRIHHWLGSGRFCPVDSRDVGEACAAILREGPIEHHTHAYQLYGPQALNFPEMVQILSKVLGYPIDSSPDITSEQVRATLQGKLPSFNVEEVIQAHETVAKGMDTSMTPDLIKLTGHAKTIQAFFEDYKSRFESRPGYDDRRTAVVEVKSTVSTPVPPATSPKEAPVQSQQPAMSREQEQTPVEPSAGKMQEAAPTTTQVQVNVAQT
jgi:NAD(P)H dehydrogenase (quinone)